MPERSSVDRPTFAPGEPILIPIAVRRDVLPAESRRRSLPLTPFVGRVRERGEIQALLARPEVRLLVLTGPGGVGKTRLGLQIATDANEEFADGVVLVGLASLRDPALVADAIADAVGIRDAGSEPLVQRLTAFMSGRATLLVLDNFEHIAAAAPLLVRLLSESPRLKVLVTSRARLNVGGEHTYTVPPLSLPGRGTDDQPVPGQASPRPDSDAVQLFIERARAIQPTFTLSPETTDTAAWICARLDGLPLAIELAAARLGHLTLGALRERLEARLPLLSRGPREHPERLRTMRAAIAWSDDLLQPPEQTLFRQLAVFAGGFTIDAAEAVAVVSSPTPALDLVASLVDQSLPQVVPEGGPRYLMIETIREYALERLTEIDAAEAARERHAAWCLSLTRQAFAGFGGPDPHLWSERLEREIANLRAALSWLDHRQAGDQLLRLATTLLPLWRFGGHPREGLGWLTRGLDLSPSAPAELTVTALNRASLLASELGDLEHGAQLAARGRDLAATSGDPGLLAHATYIVGISARTRNHPEEARRAFEAALADFRRIGDDWGAGWALCDLATLGDLGSVDAPGNPGDQALAVARCEEALRCFERLDCGIGIVRAIHGLAYLASKTRTFPLALDLAHRTLHLRSATVKDRFSLAASLEDIADIAGQTGQPLAAARLYGAAEAQREAIVAPVGPSYEAEHASEVAVCQRALDPATFASAWLAGRSLPIEAAVAEALARTIPPASTSNPTPTPSPAPVRVVSELSEREHDVLRLVVDGRSNREIAEILFISRKTAEHHVTRILAKLGVESRTAAAAEAIRRTRLWSRRSVPTRRGWWSWN